MIDNYTLATLVLWVGLAAVFGLGALWTDYKVKKDLANRGMATRISR